MMIDKIKNFLFPCEQRMRVLMQEHSEAAQNNVSAHTALMNACRGSLCRKTNLFAPL
jgi:hypothetical protein